MHLTLKNNSARTALLDVGESEQNMNTEEMFNGAYCVIRHCQLEHWTRMNHRCLTDGLSFCPHAFYLDS